MAGGLEEKYWSPSVKLGWLWKFIVNVKCTCEMTSNVNEKGKYELIWNINAMTCAFLMEGKLYKYIFIKILRKSLLGLGLAVFVETYV